MTELTFKKMDVQMGSDHSVTSTFTLDTGEIIVVSVTPQEVKLQMLRDCDDIFNTNIDDIAKVALSLVAGKFVAIYNAMHPEEQS